MGEGSQLDRESRTWYNGDVGLKGLIVRCQVLTKGKTGRSRRRTCRRVHQVTWQGYRLCTQHAQSVEPGMNLVDDTDWVSTVRSGPDGMFVWTPQRPTPLYPFPWPQPVEARDVPIEQWAEASA